MTRLFLLVLLASCGAADPAPGPAKKIIDSVAVVAVADSTARPTHHDTVTEYIDLALKSVALKQEYQDAHIQYLISENEIYRTRANKKIKEYNKIVKRIKQLEIAIK